MDSQTASPAEGEIQVWECGWSAISETAAERRSLGAAAARHPLGAVIDERAGTRTAPVLRADLRAADRRRAERPQTRR